MKRVGCALFIWRAKPNRFAKPVSGGVFRLNGRQRHWAVCADPSTVGVMLRSFLLALAALALLSSCSEPAVGEADTIFPLIWDKVTVCPATGPDDPRPDFSGENCRMTDIAQVDPQNRLLWIKAIVPLTQTSGPRGAPLALYISGKMSSTAYLNGAKVGSNGNPGTDAASEIAGQMDAVLYPSQDLFRLGDNEVVLLASSHQGYLTLSRPVHVIGIASTSNLAQELLVTSAPPLVTLGIFVLGGLYFAVMALVSASRGQFAILSAMSLSVGGQLLSESWRRFVPYDYPTHDLRLIAITAFSACFGLFVALYVFQSFKIRHLWAALFALAVVCIGAITVTSGFDYKALTGMTVPLLACLLATAIWSWQRRERAFEFFVTILVFVASIFIFSAYFLDIVFFLLVALFLLLIFVDQARVLAAEARERRSEEDRANRLEQALAQVEEAAEPGFVDVKGAGQMERIATNDIVHCKGAGGYCELALMDGRTVLHTASLNELEEALPAIFLRIHRSHLVNVQFVQSLTREASGTGTLALTQGTSLPVSRRVMPKVRLALG